jgi:hypothetical protein
VTEGVADEVEEGPSNELAVGSHVRQVARHLDGDPDVWRGGAGVVLERGAEDVVHDLAQFDTREPNLLRTREIEDLRHDTTDARRLLVEDAHALSSTIGSVALVLERGECIEDDGERVANLVRQHGAQLAHRREAFAADQLRLQLRRASRRTNLRRKQLNGDEVVIGEVRSSDGEQRADLAGDPDRAPCATPHMRAPHAFVERDRLSYGSLLRRRKIVEEEGASRPRDLCGDGSASRFERHPDDRAAVDDDRIVVCAEDAERGRSSALADCAVRARPAELDEHRLARIEEVVDGARAADTRGDLGEPPDELSPRAVSVMSRAETTTDSPQWLNRTSART